MDLDSEANQHMTRNLKLLHNYHHDCKSPIQIADGTIVSAQRHGSIRIIDFS